jgi:hypothetical protein
MLTFLHTNYSFDELDIQSGTKCPEGSLSKTYANVALEMRHQFPKARLVVTSLLQDAWPFL